MFIFKDNYNGTDHEFSTLDALKLYIIEEGYDSKALEDCEILEVTNKYKISTEFIIKKVAKEKKKK